MAYYTDQYLTNVRKCLQRAIVKTSLRVIHRQASEDSYDVDTCCGCQEDNPYNSWLTVLDGWDNSTPDANIISEVYFRTIIDNINSALVCTDITTITTHTVDYIITDTLLTASNIASQVFDQHVTVNNNAASFNLTLSVLSRKVGIKESTAEPAKTTYNNGPFNSGTIPDSVFDVLVVGSVRYLFTRGAKSFDGSIPTVFGS